MIKLGSFSGVDLHLLVSTFVCSFPVFVSEVDNLSVVQCLFCSLSLELSQNGLMTWPFPTMACFLALCKKLIY